jgi:hypothetical protein
MTSARHAIIAEDAGEEDVHVHGEQIPPSEIRPVLSPNRNDGLPAWAEDRHLAQCVSTAFIQGFWCVLPKAREHSQMSISNTCTATTTAIEVAGKRREGFPLLELEQGRPAHSFVWPRNHELDRSQHQV